MKIFRDIILLTFIGYVNLNAQSHIIRNIKFNKVGNNYVVHYDLSDKIDDEYNIELVFLRESDSLFIYKPTILSGNFGRNIKAGTNKEIVWYFKKEIPGTLKGTDFYFDIIATKEKDNGGILYYLGAGASITAGAIYYFLISSDEESTQSFIAEPPKRP